MAAGNGLAEGEQQRQIGVNAALLQNACGFNAFPGGGNLDEYAIGMNAGGLIKLNESFSTGDCGDSIEGQAGIDFCGDAAGDRVQNLATETARISGAYSGF